MKEAGMKEAGRKWQERWQALPGRERRRLLTLILCLAVGVLLLTWAKSWPSASGGQVGGGSVSGGSVSGGSVSSVSSVSGVSGGAGDTAASASALAPGGDGLSAQLQDILSQVKGAGRVQVAVWYSAGATAVYATESQEVNEERQGESGEVSRESRLTLATVGDQALLVREEAAQVQGVLVVAEGAGDPLVRERLLQGVKGLLGLRVNQIAIIEGEGSVE